MVKGHKVTLVNIARDRVESRESVEKSGRRESKVLYGILSTDWTDLIA